MQQLLHIQRKSLGQDSVKERPRPGEWKNPFFRLHFQYGVHLLCGQKEHRHHQNLVCRKTYFLPGQRPVLHQADNGRENHFCEKAGQNLKEALCMYDPDGSRNVRKR